MENDIELIPLPAEKRLPPNAIDALSAGSHLLTEVVNDLFMNDVEKSLTPAPPNTPAFEKGGYLNPKPILSADIVARGPNSNNVKRDLDPETKLCFAKLHRARHDFLKTQKNIQELKKAKDPSLQQLKLQQRQLKANAFRFMRLNIIGIERLKDATQKLDPKLVKEVQEDVKDLNDQMDKSFKIATKTNDLNLNDNDANRLGGMMDKSMNDLSDIKQTNDHRLSAPQASASPNKPNEAHNTSPAP